MKTVRVSCLNLTLSALLLVLQAMAEPSPDARARLRAILAALKSPLTKTEAHNRAAEDLRKLGTNSLPLLLDEVRSVDEIKKTNTSLAADRYVQLQAAFDALGTNARPILTDLIRDFESGRSLANAPHAIAQIGGEDAAHALIAGLTNAAPRIRSSAAAALQFMAADTNVTAAATPALIKVLQDDVTTVRAVAVTTLALFRQHPEVVVPSLLRVAEKDPDPAVRLAAINAIGSFGTEAKIAKTRLQQISHNDRDDQVKGLSRKVADRL